MMVGFPGFGIPGSGLPSTDAAVAATMVGLSVFGVPLLPPPTSGMLSAASNEGPGVQTTSPTQGTPNSAVGKWDICLNPGDKSFYVNFNRDGTVYIPDQGFDLPMEGGRWTQNGDNINWNIIDLFQNPPVTMPLTGTIHGNRMNGLPLPFGFWPDWSAKRLSSPVTGPSIAGVGPL
jgi:hypothetical protein